MLKSINFFSKIMSLFSAAVESHQKFVFLVHDNFELQQESGIKTI